MVTNISNVETILFQLLLTLAMVTTNISNVETILFQMVTSIRHVETILFLGYLITM